MKNKRKTLMKITSACLAATLLTSLAGCSGGGQSGGGKIDKTKTQLYVGILDAGMGDEYMKDLKTRFEKAYADYKGEDGKVGVEVIIDKQKETFRGSTLINNISGNRQDLYFTEQIYYDQWLRKGNLLLDITDVAEGSLSKFGEDVTIESKMYDADKNYLKRDGKYYALPFYSGYTTISYDADLFDQEGLYFDDAGEFIGTTTGEDGLPVPDLTQKSAGQDGKKGTFDDGLPITYDQFFKLCDEMKSRNITPIHWAGGYQAYVTGLMKSLYADYEGAEQFALNYSPDSGTISHYIADPGSLTGSLKDVKTTTYALSAKDATAGSIFRQAGRYYALKFVETLVKNQYSGPLSFSPSESFITAQETFLYSSRLSNGSSGKAIGMLVDGSWWYNEAKSIFEDMADTYPNSSADSRRIGIMPYPKPTADAVGKNSLVIENDTLVFINAAIDQSKVELAKDFIRFATTDESLRNFMVTTDQMRSYKYTMTDDQVKNMNFFARSYYEYLQSADWIYPRANNVYYETNVDANLKFATEVNGKSYNVPSQAFKDDASLTAEQYFAGLK